MQTGELTDFLFPLTQGGNAEGRRHGNEVFVTKEATNAAQREPLQMMRAAQTRAVYLLCTLLILSLPGLSPAEEDKGEATAASEIRHGRLELKRQATNRGTTDETTKTQLKIDAYLNGFVSLLRIEMPFPDDQTDFEGDPFRPRVGDIKIRTGFRPFQIDETPVSTYIEITFPTADPESLGSGKYQLTGGIQPTYGVPLPELYSQSHKMTFSPLFKQVVSVAGDEERKNINYTQIELALRDTWRSRFWLKLTPKPVLDWEQDARTGAVLELEAGWIINRRWSTWLMLGTRMWGEGVPSTYDQRVELGLAFLF